MEGLEIYLITSSTHTKSNSKPQKPCKKYYCKSEDTKTRTSSIPKTYIGLLNTISCLFKSFQITSINYKSLSGPCQCISSDEDLVKALANGTKLEKHLQLWVSGTKKQSISADLPPETIKESYLVPCYKKHAKGEKCQKCQNSDIINLYNEPKLKTLRYIIRSEIKNYLPRLQCAISACNEKEVHEGISCNNCGELNIKGCRYKCSICMNFDFCETCEKNNTHEHPFIKIKSPDLAPKVIFCTVEEKKQKNCKPKNRQCDAETRLLCRFVKDVIGAEDDLHEPASLFIRSWRLRNDGKTEWPEGCRLVYTNGDFGGDDAVLPELMPGEEKDISVTCRCPDKEGRYNSYWRAVDPCGNRFGQRLTIKIIVKRQEESKGESLNALIEIFNNPELVKLAYEKSGRSAQKAAEILISGSLESINN